MSKEKLLLIAEKPSLMRDLQRVYNAHKNEIPYDLDFIALSGHVCQYFEPKDYECWTKPWKELTLPMVPEKWNIKVMANKADTVDKIKKRISETTYDGFVCATDADREGNLIYYLLENKLKINKCKTYRIWIHDLTDEGFLKSYKSMVSLHSDEKQKRLTLASILRCRFDWLVGMNGTVAGTRQSGVMMNIGRVKSPVIKLVYDNSMAIDNFSSKTSYSISSVFKEGFAGSYQKDNELVSFDSSNQASKFAADNFGKTAVIKTIEKKTTTGYAPKLYKLSELQIEAEKAYGYTPDKTLSLVQSLYETHKVCSYPRTSCACVSSGQALEFSKFLNSIKGLDSTLDSYVSGISDDTISKIRTNTKYVNDNEVNKNSHTALMPTGKPVTSVTLSPEEKNIFLMICKRFVSIFLEPLVEEKITIISENNGHSFKTNGKKVINAGYTSLTGKKIEEILLPSSLSEGQALNVTDFEIKESISKPPARLTQGSIIDAMRSIGNTVEDKALKEILKESEGLGTEATRSTLVAEVIKLGYVDSKKSGKSNALYITQKGKEYIENLSGFSIISPELTAVWEEKLKMVERGELESAEFNTQMLSYVQEIITNITLAKMKNTSNTSNSRTSLGKCPRCGNDVVEGKLGFGCLGYKNTPACKFSIWKDNKFFESQGKTITAAMVKKLLNNGYVAVKGFKSAKTGKKYDANVSLDDTGQYVNFKLEFPSKNEKK